jgi:hypothetical protein
VHERQCSFSRVWIAIFAIRIVQVNASH